MTTDVVRHQSPRSWVEVLGPAHEMAVAVCKTEFVPSALRNRPEAVMACIMAGDALGIHPMVALQKIHIIEGRPGPAAELQRGMALAHGHEIWPEEVTNTRVVMCGRRRDSDNVTKTQWTLDDAKKAGLAGKQNWQRYPRAMLTARATSELCRLIFPDVLGGLSYSKEELEDGFGFDEGVNVIDADAVASDPVAEQAPTTRQRAPRRAAARTTKKAAASAPRAEPAAPSGDPMPPLPGEDEPTGEITTTMRDDNYIAMKARENGLDHHVIVRAVTAGVHESSKGLDEDEKAQVLAAITDVAEQRKVVTLTDEDVPLLVERNDDVDCPVSDGERAMLKAAIDELSKEDKDVLSKRVRGFILKFDNPAFTRRHFLLAMDRLPEAPDSAEDAAAEPEADDAGLPFE